MTKPDPASSRLFPWQVCFVVDDVAHAAEECSRRFGWGPFQTFNASVDDAEYRGEVGRRVTDVGLGMAGRVQVELIHVHEGVDCVATYQRRYGRGFQHLGIGCRSREAALERLAGCGAAVDNLNEYAGIRIAFVDVPTGPGMFELLQPTSRDAGPDGEVAGREIDTPTLELDRATIVTADMGAALDFYTRAFDWEGVEAEVATLRSDDGDARLMRARGRAGLLEIELVEGVRGGSDPYSRHLERGEHGLIHAGAPVAAGGPAPARGDYEWLESGEAFGLHDWAGGAGALQLRVA